MRKSFYYFSYVFLFTVLVFSTNTSAQVVVKDGNQYVTIGEAPASDVAANVSDDNQQKLDVLAKLKEKGLVSEDEYQAALKELDRMDLNSEEFSAILSGEEPIPADPERKKPCFVMGDGQPPSAVFIGYYSWFGSVWMGCSRMHIGGKDDTTTVQARVANTGGENLPENVEINEEAVAASTENVLVINEDNAGSGDKKKPCFVYTENYNSGGFGSWVFIGYYSGLGCRLRNGVSLQG